MKTPLIQDLKKWKKLLNPRIIFCVMMIVIASPNASANIATAITPSLTLSASDIAKLNQYFGSAPSFTSANEEHVVWKNVPLQVVLPLGKERMISFGEPVVLGYDLSQLPAALLRVQNNNGTLYLLAYDAFTTTRVQVRLVQTGKIILVDLSAQKHADQTPLSVIIDSSTPNSPATNPNATHSSAASPLADSTSSVVNYLTLTRFAAQQLYAPKRLLNAPNDIFRVPMHTSQTVMLWRDGSVITMPLASWQGNDLTVTAVLVRNVLHQVITLDPRTLCGTWLAATFFPRNSLSPTGTLDDSTTAFLISQGSLGDAMQSCGRAVS